MALRFTITVDDGTNAGMKTEVDFDDDPIVLGREEQAQLRIPDPAVSRRHCVVRRTDECLVLEDLGSRRGTRLNGTRLDPRWAVPLRVGDEIGLGSYRVRFEGERQSAEGTRAVALSLVRRLAKPDDTPPPYLRVENGPATGTRYVLRPGSKVRLGRGQECELVVDDARISRLHAVVHNQAGQVWITDTSSTNGSFVDSQPVCKPTRLHDGTAIEVGRVRLQLIEPQRRREILAAVQETVGEGGAASLIGPALALMSAAAGLLVWFWL